MTGTDSGHRGYVRALVICGFQKLVDSAVIDVLAHHGIAVEWRAESFYQGELPAECELVVVVSDTVSISGHQNIRRAARLRGLRLVSTTRKKSIMTKDLEASGFRPVGGNAADAIRQGGALSVEKHQQPKLALAASAQQRSAAPGISPELKRRLLDVVRELKEAGAKSLVWSPEIGLELVVPVVRIEDATLSLDDLADGG